MRSKQGILLEKLLHSTEHRYTLCWAGEGSDSSCYDCACCITYLDLTAMRTCGCICHKRIDKMAENADVFFWLNMLESSKELPVFFYSEDEKVEHLLKNPHRENCDCENCMFLKRVAERKAKENK